MDADIRLQAAPFRSAGQGGGQRVRWILARGRALGIGELSRALHLEELTVRALLEELVATGEAERLRPVAYPGDDMDYYRLLRADERALCGQAG
jgi:predicted ArsR family transcriptional regulator